MLPLIFATVAAFLFGVCVGWWVAFKEVAERIKSLEASVSYWAQLAGNKPPPPPVLK